MYTYSGPPHSEYKAESAEWYDGEQDVYDSAALNAMYVASGYDGAEGCFATGWQTVQGRKGKGKGKSKSDGYVVPCRRLMLAQGGGTPSQGAYTKGKGRGSKGSYGKGGAWSPPQPYPPQRAYDAAYDAVQQVSDTAWNAKDGCFAHRCPAKRHSMNGKAFEVCLTCHTTGLEKGSVLGRDGKTYAVLSQQHSTPEARREALAKLVVAVKAYRATYQTKATMLTEESAYDDLEQYIVDGHYAGDDAAQEGYMIQQQPAMKRAADDVGGPTDYPKRNRPDEPNALLAALQARELSAVQAQVQRLNNIQK